MPHWADKASQYPGFQLERRVEVTDLMEKSGQVVGVTAQAADGPLQVRAGLVVGADGRRSAVRERAGLEPAAGSPPMDVLGSGCPAGPTKPSPSSSPELAAY